MPSGNEALAVECGSLVCATSTVSSGGVAAAVSNSTE